MGRLLRRVGGRGPGGQGSRRRPTPALRREGLTADLAFENQEELQEEKEEEEEAEEEEVKAVR
jgi:hypothetical protein